MAAAGGPAWLTLEPSLSRVPDPDALTAGASLPGSLGPKKTERPVAKRRATASASAELRAQSQRKRPRGSPLGAMSRPSTAKSNGEDACVNVQVCLRCRRVENGPRPQASPGLNIGRCYLEPRRPRTIFRATPTRPKFYFEIYPMLLRNRYPAPRFRPSRPPTPGADVDAPADPSPTLLLPPAP